MSFILVSAWYPWMVLTRFFSCVCSFIIFVLSSSGHLFFFCLLVFFFSLSLYLLACCDLLTCHGSLDLLICSGLLQRATVCWITCTCFTLLLLLIYPGLLQFFFLSFFCGLLNCTNLLSCSCFELACFGLLRLIKFGCFPQTAEFSWHATACCRLAGLPDTNYVRASKAYRHQL